MGSEYYHRSDWETGLRSFTHAIGLVIGAFLLSVISVYVAAAFISAAGVTVDDVASLPPVPYAVITASQFVGFFAAVGAYLHWRGYPDLFDGDVPSIRDVGWIVVGFVGLYVIAFLVGLVFQALGIESATNAVVEQGQQAPVRFLYLIPVTLLFVAPAEELLFRGVVQGLFRRAFGIVPGVLLASAVFGFGHWLALTGSSGGKLAYVGVAATLGLLLGTLYERTDNIVVPIAAHGLWNTFLFLVQYGIATGRIPEQAGSVGAGLGLAATLV